MTFTVTLGVSQWVQLPDYVRRRIASLFGLIRTGGADVQNNILITDGFTEKDLSGITVLKMQELVHSEIDNYFELFDRVLEYVENERSGKAVELEEERLEREQKIQATAAQSAMETIAAISEAVKPIIKKRGRPAKE